MKRAMIGFALLAGGCSGGNAGLAADTAATMACEAAGQSIEVRADNGAITYDEASIRLDVLSEVCEGILDAIEKVAPIEGE
jgi:hypothetical protein